MLYRAEFLPVKNFHVQKNENWKDEDIWYGYVIRIRRDKIKNEDIWDKIRMVLTRYNSILAYMTLDKSKVSKPLNR